MNRDYDVSGRIGNQVFPHLVLGGEGNRGSNEHVYASHWNARGIEGLEDIF